jgi:poly-beta-1,6-N-acetyl-D-glucosamine synthase
LKDKSKSSVTKDSADDRRTAAFCHFPQTPMISIVIPAYNEEEGIVRTLESLARQKTNRAFEVILVDNGSTDNTRTIAERFCSRMNLHILSEPRKGRGIARRRGCASARGTMLLSTDADVVVPAEWIEAMARALEKPGIVGVVGDVHIDDCPEWINQGYNVIRPFIATLFRVTRGYWLLNGGNSGYRRWAYEACGGFSSAMDASDDRELSSRIRKFGRTRFELGSMVSASGRRFRNGLLAGALSYPRAFFRKMMYREERVRLENIR